MPSDDETLAGGSGLNNSQLSTLPTPLICPRQKEYTFDYSTNQFMATGVKRRDMTYGEITELILFTLDEEVQLPDALSSCRDKTNSSDLPVTYLLSKLALVVGGLGSQLMVLIKPYNMTAVQMSKMLHYAIIITNTLLSPRMQNLSGVATQLAATQGTSNPAGVPPVSSTPIQQTQAVNSNNLAGMGYPFSQYMHPGYNPFFGNGYPFTQPPSQVQATGTTPPGALPTVPGTIPVVLPAASTTTATTSTPSTKVVQTLQRTTTAKGETTMVLVPVVREEVQETTSEPAAKVRKIDYLAQCELKVSVFLFFPINNVHKVTRS